MSPQEFLHIFNGYFDQNSKILDIGCGDCSNYQSYFVNNSLEYIGVDVSDKALKRAQSKGYKVIKLDLSDDLPFMDNYFDLVICLEVLEHLFDPKEVVLEIDRVLKDYGHFILSVPNIGYFRDRLVFLFKAFINNSPFDENNPWAGAHVRFFSKRSLMKLLRSAGFKKIKIISSMNASIFDFFDVIYPEISKPFRRLPGFLRLSFLSRIWPSMFSDHLIVVARKV